VPVDVEADGQRGFAMKSLIAVLAIGTVLGATAAQAGVVHGRQRWQDHRIQRGVCGRSLTRAEARILRAEQRAVARARWRALADGAISRQEARFLARAQNRADRHIDRLTHNRRMRSGW
jgi:hypothetical protein